MDIFVTKIGHFGHFNSTDSDQTKSLMFTKISSIGRLKSTLRAGMKNIWDKIKEDALVSNFRFHDLRHTVGTRLAQANVPVPVIKELLAHSDVKTTMRYIHTVSQEMESAMAILSKKH